MDRIDPSGSVAAVARVTRGLLHELRNALTPLSADAWLLEARADDPEAVRALARRLQGALAATHERRLLRHLREFARRDVPAGGAPVPLERLAREAAALAAALRPDVPLTVHGDPTVEVAADAGLLRDALLELCANALRASPAGGAVRLTVRGEGATAEVEVSDDGPGLPAVVRSALELPFAGADPSAAASGTGLAFVAAATHRHGGQVAIDSLTRGTTIRLRLPLAAGRRADDGADQGER